MIFALGLVLGTVSGLLLAIAIEVVGQYVRYRRGRGAAWRVSEPGA